MTVSIGNDSGEMFFGRGMILSSLEAEPLRFTDDFPGRDVWDRTPMTRRVMLEGYFISTASDEEGRIAETAHRRRMLSAITAPGGEFFLRVNDRRAELCDGQLVFKRSAPFSGDTAEHFTLTAVIKGGYFHGGTVTLTPREGCGGFSFPLVSDGGFTVGEYNESSYIEVHNGGDVPVGFEAEFTPDATVASFSLEDLSRGRSIVISRSFYTDDVIKISTHRDRLYLRVERDGADHNLSGYAADESELFTLPVGRTVLSLGGGATFKGRLSFAESFVSF